MNDTHPLYRAADRLLSRPAHTPRQLKRLARLFRLYELPIPLDLAAALMGECGHVLAV